MGIRVEHLMRRYGAVAAVNDVSFDISSGALVAFLGPSGSGKTTLLRMIAGLEPLDGGAVWLEGERVEHLPVRQMGVGFVFQQYALFRHMTVADNVAFGLSVRGEDKVKQRARVDYLLDLVGLGGLQARYPWQLSGGQRQRVALARALAPQPRVLLLDEPFGAVDAKVREELRQWLRRLHDEVHVTSIFVTHDQEEAFAIADRVMVVRDGRIEQDGAPSDIIDHPATEFIARFVGEANVYEARVERGQVELGGLVLPVEGFASGQRVRLVMRAYDLKFWRQEGGPGTVTRVIPLGDKVRVDARLMDGTPIFAFFPRRSSLLKGLEVHSPIQIEVVNIRAWRV